MSVIIALKNNLQTHFKNKFKKNFSKQLSYKHFDI